MKRILFIFLLISLLIFALGINASAFSDVSQDAWYAESVEYVVNNHLFHGTSSTTFSPDATMTRGMFCTVLGRMANISAEFSTDGVITKSYVNLRSKPTTDSEKLGTLDKGAAVEVLDMADTWYKVRYDGLTGYIRCDLMSATVEGLVDVNYEKYYSPYISWAYKNGIASGTDSSTFSPDSPITREDICVFLSKYCSFYDLTLPSNMDKKTFSDESKIRNAEAVYALQQAGIINGRNNGCFDPGASVQRSEVAALFQRYADAGITVADSDPDDNYTGYRLFGKVPPLTEPVNPTYFDDACFIGHSLVVGMKSYFYLPNADYYGVSGISAKGMLTYDRFTLEETYEDSSGNSVNKLGTIQDVLNEKNYGKIYIMLGVNELGPLDEHLNSYYNNMSKLIDNIKISQPRATIYLISITPIGKTRSDDSDNYNRTNTLKFNDKLQQISVEKNVYYLDAFGVFTDDCGYIPENQLISATDGVHLNVSSYSILKNYISTHAL